MLQVRDGDMINIATPEAVQGDDLRWLESEVLSGFRGHLLVERAARTDAQRLYISAIRQIIRILKPSLFLEDSRRDQEKVSSSDVNAVRRQTRPSRAS
jgi:hypothetical protein